MPLNPEYVMSYSPGKVGSTSILETLRTVNVPCHRCEDHNIKQYHKKDWPTITGVREPLAWVFSHIFEKLLAIGRYPTPEDAPNVVESIQNGRWNQDLMYYCDWYWHDYRQTTGINLAGQRWVKKHGWKIFSMRALVVRTDRFDDVMEEALHKFLPQYYPEIDMSTLEVQHRAKGTERFEGYEEFMDAVKFDVRWLVNFYDKNKLSNFFFFRNELKELVMKWSKNK
jgi:hypothetical protein